MSAAQAVRAQAARALKRVALDGASLRAVLPEAAAALPDARDRALLHALLFESARWYLRLDGALKRLLERSLLPREGEMHCLLVLGLAQLEYLNLPAYAAVAATVEAARELNRPRHAALINAVLRRYLRERETINAALDADWVTRYSHPAWLIAALKRDWPAQAEAILVGDNAAAPLWLRVQRRHGDAASYRAGLVALGITAAQHPRCPDALVLEQSTDVTALPGFADGHFSVQDGSAQLAAVLLDLQPGQRVLDACAAPGGKSAHILELEPGVALLALDREPARLVRVEANLRRLGLNATLRAADATQPDTWWDGIPFQRILLDAPCSGTGVIRRQPDIKLHRRASDLPALLAAQAALLDALWPLLAVGGRLVYATCSWLKDENERQVAAFLARTPQAEVVDAVPQAWGVAAGVGRQNLPGDDGMDGFFYAVLAKRG